MASFSRPRSSRPATEPARRWSEAEAAPIVWRRCERSGDARLRDRLLLTYTPLVEFIVDRKIGELPASCDAEDLVSAGLEALVKAIDCYDRSNGATLEQFAWTRIHGAVIDELRRSDWAPRSLRRWERDMRRAQSDFCAIHGREPSQSELAEATRTTADELRERQRALASSDVASLNSLVLAHDGARVERVDVLVADDDDGDPFRASAKHEAKQRFRRAFAALERREREVAVLLYAKNITLRETGELLGVSESRVCQIHSELKRTLRRTLADDADLIGYVA